VKYYKENHPQFWEDIYLEDDAGWDLGESTLVFDKISDALPLGKVCIIGCGRGYDAVMFAQKGFEVTAIDFAPSAISTLQSLASGAGVMINIVETDIFLLTSQFSCEFDYVIEQTCFCAINPSRREEYEQLVKTIIKPNGKLIGLWFPLDKPMDDGGPPWGTTISEVKSIFYDGWKIEKEEFPELSISPRKNREKLIIFKRC
tara:strand:- start:142 stop:747 length:606 start_codon:yes stop_codon:yes gene_type:complete